MADEDTELTPASSGSSQPTSQDETPLQPTMQASAQPQPPVRRATRQRAGRGRSSSLGASSLRTSAMVLPSASDISATTTPAVNTVRTSGTNNTPRANHEDSLLFLPSFFLFNSGRRLLVVLQAVQLRL